jgi:hypothetical protein
VISLCIRRTNPGNNEKRVRGKKHEPYTESPNSPRPIKARQWRAKSTTCYSFSLTSRRLLTTNSPWEAKKSLPHTTVTFCDDCVNMCEDFAPNFGYKKLAVLSWKLNVLHFFFHQGIFDKRRHDSRHPLTLIFNVVPIEDKTERPSFWHNWGDRGALVGGAEHPYRKRLPECI